MAKCLLMAVFLLITGKAVSQMVYELYPTRTSSISYAVHTNNSLDCFSEIRQNGFNYGPWIPPFKAGFYLSTDTIITPADILIADCPVPCMNGTSCGTYPSNTNEWLKLVSVTNIDLTQQSIPTATYYVGVYLDREDVIAEFTSANNGLAFRNTNNEFTIINYPVLDIGFARNTLEKDLEKRYVNGELLIQSKSGRELHVELYSVDGRLIYRSHNASAAVPKQDGSLYLLWVSSTAGTFVEKLVL